MRLLPSREGDPRTLLKHALRQKVATAPGPRAGPGSGMLPGEAAKPHHSRIVSTGATDAPGYPPSLQTRTRSARSEHFRTRQGTRVSSLSTGDPRRNFRIRPKWKGLVITTPGW